MKNINDGKFDERLESKVGDIVLCDKGEKFECVKAKGKGSQCCYQCAFDTGEFMSLCPLVTCSAKARKDGISITYTKRKDL